MFKVNMIFKNRTWIRSSQWETPLQNEF